MVTSRHLETCNKYWVLFALAFSIYWIAYTLTQSGMIYYAQYILGDQGYQPSMVNVMQILSLAGMLVAFLLSKQHCPIVTILM